MKKKEHMRLTGYDFKLFKVRTKNIRNKTFPSRIVGLNPCNFQPRDVWYTTMLLMFFKRSMNRPKVRLILRWVDMIYSVNI